MRKGKHAVIGLFALLLIGMHGVSNPGLISTMESYDNALVDSEAVQPLRDLFRPRAKSNSYTPSDTTLSGTIDPISVKQSGYVVSDNITARTDTGTNAAKNLTIDDANSWATSRVELEVWDLKRIYVENGTFEDGTAGWTGVTYDPDGSQIQTTTYNSTGEYVVCENIGPETQAVQNIYTHYASSEVLWEQNVTNAPLVQEWYLTFSFLYASGPLDPLGNDGLNPVYIAVFFDGSGWGWDLTGMGARDEWFVLGDIFVDPFASFGTPLGSTFDFQIGLYFPLNVDLDADLDYDDDTIPDGVGYAESIEVWIDEISLVGMDPLGFNQVEMNINAGALSDSITDPGSTGTGTASISNPTFWSTDPLEVDITSNMSVSFDYRITSYSHRVTNSTWTSNPSMHGVSYSIEAGMSADLSTYTYVGTAGYENLTLEIQYPLDWENATIFNPFLNDVTSQCIISPGLIVIPNSQLDRLGWWEVDFDSPNYCKLVVTQRYSQGSGLWTDTSTFGTSNTTRIHAELGTLTETPNLNSPVNATWTLPNGTVWASESITNGLNAEVNGSSWTLGTLNTSAGPWTVHVEWSNGTEVAHGEVAFDMYHSATLTPIYSQIDTDSGFDVTGLLYYVDSDSGEYLMEDSATIVGNWSGPSISFVANPLQRWWQADFDTSLVDAGQYIVVVNASRPYYGDVSCQFSITITHQTDFALTSVGGLPTEVGLHEILTVYMQYDLANGTGINGATMQMAYTGPAGGLTFLGQSSSIPGNYSIDLTSTLSGIYTVTLTASKAYHHNKSESFTLIVGETGTSLTILNGTADFVDMGGSYRLVVEFTNSTGHGIDTADVEVTSVIPSSGLGYSVASYEGNGHYSFTLTPATAGTYTLIVRANLTNHVTQIGSFTLTASTISTVLTSDGSGATIAVLESYTVQLTLVDDQSNGIAGATISVLDPPSGLSFVPADLTGGVYNLTITGSMPGTYQLAIRASKTNYVNSTVGFTVLVRGFESIFTVMNGTADYVTFGSTYMLVLEYTNGTGFGLDGASIEIIDRTPSVGLGDGPVFDEGSGYYSITLTPTSAEIFSILIKANLTVYTTQIVSFSLTVREIPTILTLDAPGATISVDQSHVAQITFRDDSLNGLEGATIIVLNPPVGLGYSVANISSGQYTLTLYPSMIGTYEFAIRATLSNYLNSTVGFTLVVRTIPTELMIIEGIQSDSIYFMDEYSLTLVYIRTDNGQNVSSADLTVSTLPVEGLTVSLTNLGDLYLLGFVADTVGKWQVFFTSNKTDHISGFIEFELEVLPVAIEIAITQGLREVEGAHNVLRLSLTESVSGNPVSGATVEYQLISEVGPGEIHPMPEGDSGIYTATFQMPSFTSNTSVRIYVTIENYEIGADYYEAVLDPILSEIEALNRIIRDYSLFIGIISIVAVGYGSRRAYIRRQRKQYIDAMLVKRRFDDVKGLLGVIVLHKNTGMPIYAKMLKEGLDELLVSGFVSAISTFRSEFSVDQENWVLTLISDIIRTVATENLICAFISLAPPSRGQELRMVEFAEAVGFVFDNMYTEMPLTAIEPETEAQFTAFFDDIMDGRFLREYTVTEGKKFPRKTKCIEDRLHRIDDEDGFDLDELATEMTSCGLEEARVYAIIMDAIEMGNLIFASIDEAITEEKLDSVAEPLEMEGETESEVSEPPTEIEIKLEEAPSDISEEKKFLEDVESLLQKESDEEKEE
ncbi:MAG: hypothetical protein ACXADC_05545 [Candidatus Thorarchaeota archaeon]|jgi:hypothetical protein